MDFNYDKKLSTIIEQAITTYIVEVSNLKIHITKDFKDDFLFKNPKQIGKLIESSIFSSVCNTKFIEDKWIVIRGQYDFEEKTYQLIISDSKALVQKANKEPLRSKFKRMLKRKKSYEDKVFYNYQKSRYTFSPLEGNVVKLGGGPVA